MRWRKNDTPMYQKHIVTDTQPLQIKTFLFFLFDPVWLFNGDLQFLTNFAIQTRFLLKKLWIFCEFHKYKKIIQFACTRLVHTGWSLGPTAHHQPHRTKSKFTNRFRFLEHDLLNDFDIDLSNSLVHKDISFSYMSREIYLNDRKTESNTAKLACKVTWSRC